MGLLSPFDLLPVDVTRTDLLIEHSVDGISEPEVDRRSTTLLTQRERERERGAAKKVYL